MFTSETLRLIYGLEACRVTANYSQGYLKSSERELSAFSDQRSAFEAAQ
jgi:hypothetical protein